MDKKTIKEIRKEVKIEIYDLLQYGILKITMEGF